MMSLSWFNVLLGLGIIVFALWTPASNWFRYRRSYPDRLHRQVALRRIQHVQTSFSVVATIVLMVIAFMSGTYFAGSRRDVAASTLFMIGAGLSVVASILARRRKRGIEQRLRAENYRVCPSCYYSLRGSPHQGRCSECGQAYTAESLKGDWLFALHEGLNRTNVTGE